MKTAHNPLKTRICCLYRIQHNPGCLWGEVGGSGGSNQTAPSLQMLQELARVTGGDTRQPSEGEQSAKLVPRNKGDRKAVLLIGET